MKRILTMAAAVAMSVAAHGQPYEWNSTNTVNGVIPDNDPSGLGSQVTVNGLVADIQNVTVSLDITGGYNGDLYAYLAGPNGGFAVLLNRVGEQGGNAGGYSDTGFDITLDDGVSAPDIHLYQNDSPVIVGGQLTGTWGTDGEAIAPNSSPSSYPVAPTETLGSFDGLGGNGTWTLFLTDLAAGDQSTVMSWSLDITTVPEPPSLALGAMGVAGLIISRKLRLRK